MDVDDVLDHPSEMCVARDSRAVWERRMENKSLVNEVLHFIKDHKRQLTLSMQFYDHISIPIFSPLF